MVAGGTERIEVADDGPGIPAADREGAFRPFQSGAPGGTGLGLAVSLHLAEAMQGRLRAENRPEGGARFCLHLAAS